MSDTDLGTLNHVPVSTGSPKVNGATSTVGSAQETLHVLAVRMSES